MIDILIKKAVLEYMEIYGQAESRIIMERLLNSKKFNENVDIAFEKKIVFSGAAINLIIASSHWKLAIGNKRKIYYGSLLFLSIIYGKFEHAGYYIDEAKFAESLADIRANYDKML